jgi:hypothetical protein
MVLVCFPQRLERTLADGRTLTTDVEFADFLRDEDTDLRARMTRPNFVLPIISLLSLPETDGAELAIVEDADLHIVSVLASRAKVTLVTRCRVRVTACSVSEFTRREIFFAGCEFVGDDQLRLPHRVWRAVFVDCSFRGPRAVYAENTRTNIALIDCRHISVVYRCDNYREVMRALFLAPAGARIGERDVGGGDGAVLLECTNAGAAPLLLGTRERNVDASLAPAHDSPLAQAAGELGLTTSEPACTRAPRA